MKKGYVVPVLCALSLLLVPVSALAQPTLTCDRPADEESRVAAARAILKVGLDDYQTVINYWAVNGSGEDGVGEDGAVYRETVLSNNSRQEMYEYLDYIFNNYSSDMELDIIEELYQTHPDDSMTYMATNKWYGTSAAGYYEQPGMSIVKFRPGEGCACYQRDYFTEGDTWWGIPGLDTFVVMARETYINMFQLTGRCFDEDGDGYTKYAAATGCPQVGLDCNDYVAEINPGAEEIMDNGIDDDCDGSIDGAPVPLCAAFPGNPEGPATLLAYFGLFLVPAIYGYILKRRFSRNRIN